MDEARLWDPFGLSFSSNGATATRFVTEIIVCETSSSLVLTSYHLVLTSYYLLLTKDYLVTPWY